jgi:hypothetical protein
MKLRSFIQSCVTALPLLALFAAPATGAVEERELKAAIIFNILLFVDWPAQSLPEPGGALALCVATDSTLNAALKGLNHRPIRNFRLEVRDLAPAEAVSSCHAVFVDAPDRARRAGALKEMLGHGALVFSDDADSPEDAIAIVLQRVDGRIGFEVNLQPVRQARLHLSSKLLRLARTVRE